jgi:hypothetical protein
MAGMCLLLSVQVDVGPNRGELGPEYLLSELSEASQVPPGYDRTRR